MMLDLLLLLILMIITHVVCPVSFTCILMILHLSLLLHSMHVIFYCTLLSIAQHVVDSVPWCADTSGDYYGDQAGEEIPKDL